MSEETKNEFDDSLLESDTPLVSRVLNNPVEETTDDGAVDAIGKTLDLGNDNEESVGSSKIENPGEEPRKLKEQLSKKEEQLQAFLRSKDRAVKELQELLTQGEAADKKEMY